MICYIMAISFILDFIPYHTAVTHLSIYLIEYAFSSKLWYCIMYVCNFTVIWQYSYTGYVIHASLLGALVLLSIVIIKFNSILFYIAA